MKKGSAIKLMVFDVDGVLTDGSVYVDSRGRENKRYKLTEIDSLNDIKNIGIRIGAITGEDTPIVDVFEKNVGWDFFVRGCKNKLESLKIIEKKLGLESQNIGYIGDGKYDIECITYAGLGVCPQNAIFDVKNVSDVVLSGFGGDSCIYELLYLLKKINGDQNDRID